MYLSNTLQMKETTHSVFLGRVYFLNSDDFHWSPPDSSTLFFK